MDNLERKNILQTLGASEADTDLLLAYTENAFAPRESDGDEDGFLEKWKPVLETARSDGTTAALNRHLCKEELQIAFQSPETVHIEMFPSLGGTI